MEEWIGDYVDRKTTGAIKGVEDAEAAVQQVHEEKKKAENMGFRNSEPEQTFQGMTVAIGDSLRDLASCHDGEELDDEDAEETE
jgi:hypothetical protein